jgi:hypothetical protein
MNHQFTYPKVTEIRRVSLEVAGLAVLLTRPDPSASPLRAPAN